MNPIEWKPREGMKETYIARAYLCMVNQLKLTSKCDRAGHACVLTTLDLHNVIAIGYNGPASGLPNKCERPDEPGNCGCIHAEANAVAKAGDPKLPKAAFITGHPCENCAKLLMQTNVQLVIYPGPAHRPVGGPEYLDRRGIVHGTLDDPWVIDMLQGMQPARTSSSFGEMAKYTYGLPTEYARRRGLI